MTMTDPGLDLDKEAALLAIDEWLRETGERSMYSVEQVRDMLLDLRQLLGPSGSN